MLILDHIHGYLLFQVYDISCEVLRRESIFEDVTFKAKLEG
jgi:hypothetical protein